MFAKPVYANKNALWKHWLSFHQRRSVMLKLRQIIFRRGSSPDPAGGAHNAPQVPYRLGRGIAPPHSSPPRRPWRLDLVAFGLARLNSKVYHHLCCSVITDQSLRMFQLRQIIPHGASEWKLCRLKRELHVHGTTMWLLSALRHQQLV